MSAFVALMSTYLGCCNKLRDEPEPLLANTLYDSDPKFSSFVTSSHNAVPIPEASESGDGSDNGSVKSDQSVLFTDDKQKDEPETANARKQSAGEGTMLGMSL